MVFIVIFETLCDRSHFSKTIRSWHQNQMCYQTCRINMWWCMGLSCSKINVFVDNVPWFSQCSFYFYLSCSCALLDTTHTLFSYFDGTDTKHSLKVLFLLPHIWILSTTKNSRLLGISIPNEGCQPLRPDTSFQGLAKISSHHSSFTQWLLYQALPGLTLGIQLFAKVPIPM